MTGTNSRGTVARLFVALIVGFGGSIAITFPAAAECLYQPAPRTTDAYVGYGFEAVVTEASDGPGVPGHFDWEVILNVTHVYEGNVPKSLVIAGYSHVVTCGWFHGEFLHVGDRLLVTTDQLQRRSFGLHVLAWRKADVGWMFDNSLIHSHDSGVYAFIPRVARVARTTSGILAIMRGGLPETSTETPTRGSDALLLGLLPGVAVAAAFMRRRSRRVSEQHDPERKRLTLKVAPPVE